MSWFENILNAIQKWSDDTMKSAVSFKNVNSHKVHKKEKNHPHQHLKVFLLRLHS